MEGENTKQEKKSHDTEMTAVLHTDTGTTTASEPAEPGKVSMSEEGRCVSILSETPFDILPKCGSFDNIVELSMDMIEQGSEGERSTSGDQTMHATRQASTGDEARAHLYAADRDSFRRTHFTSSARAVGYTSSTLHSAPSLRDTTSNCLTATSNRSTDKDLVALVDTVSFFVHFRAGGDRNLCDICDMNASLNVLLYLSGIVFEAGSSRPPPPGAPLCFPLCPFYFPLFLYLRY
jgi:hypothetical protein